MSHEKKEPWLSQLAYRDAINMKTSMVGTQNARNNKHDSEIRACQQRIYSHKSWVRIMTMVRTTNKLTKNWQHGFIKRSINQLLVPLSWLG